MKTIEEIKDLIPAFYHAQIAVLILRISLAELPKQSIITVSYTHLRAHET